jgi:hypothetical protein
MEYTLIKNTCGAPIGHEALLLGKLRGQLVSAILNNDENSWLNGENTLTDDELFLYYKHLFAIRAALKVAYGLNRGGPEDPCAISSMGCDINGALIEGLISVEALTKEIKSCGNCKSCGS